MDYHHVLANIHFLKKADGKVTFGVQADGMFASDATDIIAHLKEIKAALLIVDPFNHAHDLDDGNNNVAIAKVAGEMTRIAHESQVAVLVLHHLRKGATGNPDDLMGATSLRATFRTCRIMVRMTEAEASSMNIEDAWRYVRNAGSKENYAPPASKGRWIRLVSVALGNVTNEYPEGDEIAVAATWSPPAAFEGMDAAALRSVFQAYRDTAHGPFKQTKKIPWAGKPLMEKGSRTEREAASILKAWLENEVLTTQGHYETDGRNTIKKVVLDEEKVSEILSGITPPGCPRLA